MKRITLLLSIGLALVLVACGGEAGTVQTAGHWEGELQTAGIRTPFTFTVDAEGKVASSSFKFDYKDWGLSYSVTSHSSSNSLTVVAEASSTLGSVTFELDGTVKSNTMTGGYTLIVMAGSEGTPLSFTGDFTATRDSP